MTDRPKQKSAAELRREREAAALRANLRRRKEQARARAESDAAPPEGSHPGEPDQRNAPRKE